MRVSVKRASTAFAKFLPSLLSFSFHHDIPGKQQTVFFQPDIQNY